MSTDVTAIDRKNAVQSQSNKCITNDIPLFSCLNGDEMKRIELNSINKFLKKDTSIYREGCRHSGVYIVLNGIVKIYKIGPQGKHNILRFAKSGDIIAYRSLLTNELACTTARAHSDNVFLCYLPKPIFMELLQNNPKFNQSIMRIMCRELDDSNNMVMNIAQKNLRERTAQVLLALKKEFGVDYSNTLRITLTRADMANMIGTVSESLIRVLAQFRDDGLLAIDGKRIVFLDIPKLDHIANMR